MHSIAAYMCSKKGGRGREEGREGRRQRGMEGGREGKREGGREEEREGGWEEKMYKIGKIDHLSIYQLTVNKIVVK